MTDAYMILAAVGTIVATPILISWMDSLTKEDWEGVRLFLKAHAMVGAVVIAIELLIGRGMMHSLAMALQWAAMIDVAILIEYAWKRIR